MDVEAAFPSIAWDCLARKMRKIGVDQSLVMWMLDFMMESRVRMVAGAGMSGTSGNNLTPSGITGLTHLVRNLHA